MAAVAADLDSTFQLLRHMPAVLQDCRERRAGAVKLIQQIQQEDASVTDYCATVLNESKRDWSSTSYFDASCGGDLVQLVEEMARESLEEAVASSETEDGPKKPATGLGGRFISLFKSKSSLANDEELQQSTQSAVAAPLYEADVQEPATNIGRDEVTKNTAKKSSSVNAAALKTTSSLATEQRDEKDDVRASRSAFLDRLAVSNQNVSETAHTETTLLEASEKQSLPPKESQEAASVIQRAWKCHVFVVRLKAHLKIILEEKLKRQHRRKVAKGLARRLRSSIAIQCIVRGYMAREQFAKILTKHQAASSVIQRAWRVYQFRASREAASIIQRCWKHYRWLENERVCRASTIELRDTDLETDVFRNDFFQSSPLRPWSDSPKASNDSRKKKTGQSYNKYRSLLDEQSEWR